MEHIFIDVYVKKGDAFSKFAQILKIENETADELIEAITNYFKIFGLPKIITCDQATSFRSSTFKTFLQNYNIDIHYASTSNSNGIVERFHNTLLEMYLANIRKVENLTLYKGLSIITALYNDTKHSTTKLSPRLIIFGNSHSLNQEDINLHKMQTIQTARENIASEAKAFNSKIEINDNKEYENITQNQVLVKGKRKPTPYTNRFRVIEIKNQTNKTITDEHDIKIHKTDMKREN